MKNLILTIILALYVGCSALPGSLTETDAQKKAQQKADRANTLSLLAIGRPITNGTNGSNATVSYSGARVTNSADINTSNGVYSFLTYDTVSYDTSSYFPGSGSDKLVIPTTGYYEVTGSVTYNGNATGFRKISVIKNNETSPSVIASTSSTAVSATDLTSITTSVSQKFNAGDTLRLQIYQTSGGSLIISANSYNPVFTIYRLPNN